jgi:hypothetical protein
MTQFLSKKALQNEGLFLIVFVKLFKRFAHELNSRPNLL